MTNKEKVIVLISNDFVRPSDAIILLEGDGYNRIPKAVSLYKHGFAKRIVFSGGITDYSYGSYPFEDVLPYILNEGVPKSDLIHESKSLNTREQAIEVIKLAIQKKWEKIILVASSEHQYRAYLTFLRVIIDSGKNIVVYNAPERNLTWFTDDPWGKRIERLDAEFQRIEHYYKLKHLATFEEVIEYQKWKEQLQ